ncbi:TonB-dependent receptor [Stenotrophomonas sp. MMGLT7]|uniref:TonB-dependent receptor n=1 Tax=Stenotrophomonas sp. MMGLT7 TaxID=2901227 RepID=UPI001E4AD204|nr:TonB-dependent receptor [Stenotrophomonas sp. MMGLT7]MCD7097871.1 TonB-dependent receptor [Stenotrophomonas sp. MMGLT7]
MSARSTTSAAAVHLACLLGLSAVPASPAIAQQVPPDPDAIAAKDLDAVIVTGRSGVDSRTKAETSYSVTNIEEEALRLQAPTSVTEAVKSVPGFWVESTGGEASGNVRARGIPIDGFGSVTLLEDGVPVVHDPALGYLNGDQAFRLDETIERVEVVRGGPSSVFYSNAPAGAINFIPRQVGDEPSGIFKYTVGDYGLNRVDVYYGAPLGNGWKLGMGGFYRVDDGIRDPGYRANDGGQFRFNLAREFDGGRISFDAKHMDDRVMLYLGIPMHRNGSGDIVGVPGFDAHYGTVAGPETRYLRMKTGDGSLYDFDNADGTHVKRDQGTIKLDLDLGADWKLAQALRFSKTDTTRNGVFPNALSPAATFLEQQQSLLAGVPGATGLQLRYITSPSQVFDPASQNGTGLMIMGGLRGLTMPVREFGSDTRLMRKFQFGGQSHDVTLGYYYATVSEDFDRYSSTVLLDAQDQARLLDLVAVDAAGNVLRTFSDNGVWRYGYEWENASGQSTTQAFYLSDEWQVSDALRLDAGLRHEKIDSDGWAEVRQTVDLGTLATSSVLTGSGRYVRYDQSSSKTGWTVGANYQFDDRQGVFARWSSAFRLPSLGSYLTRNSNCPLATLEACGAANGGNAITQTMDLGEVGYKFNGPLFNVYATAFYTKFDNVPFSNYVYDPDTGVSVNQQGYAGTRTWGLELEAGWYPTHWFDAQLTATWQDPRYKGLKYSELVDGAPVLRDYVDNQLIRVPRLSTRLVPGVNLLEQKLRLQLSWEWEGKRYVDTANSVQLPSYDVLNFSARYEVSDRLSLYGYIDNVTNSLGLTEGNPRAGELQNADVGASSFIARPLLGRAYRLALMYRF